MFDVKTYEPAGATVKRFHESDKFVRLMAGPIGSAKTTAAGVAEVFFTAMMQTPMPDGVRRAKVGILRDTYRNLYATFIPTWFRWVPREIGHFVGSDDRPAVHSFGFDAPLLDGSGRMGPCEVIVEMKALGANSVEMVCRGWELTGAMIDEADGLVRESIAFLKGRVMRYPDKPYRRSRGVWGTFNKPDIDHWLYEICVESPPSDLEFFDQPGGLLDGGPPYVTNPYAENLENLDDGYYTIAAEGQQEWYVRRMLRNKWGASVSGELIYPEFRDEGQGGHMSPVELEPAPHSILKLGMDGGGTPAAVILGRDAWGRRISYGEVVLVDPADPRKRKLATGVGPRRFAEAVRDAIYPRFKSCNFEIGYADPAAFYGADREAGEYSWVETVANQLGIPLDQAPSNEIALRLEAVRSLLTKIGADGRPNLIINSSCTWLRRGFVSDYKWQEVDPKQPGKRITPQKSVTSHVHDALQYACLGDVGRAGITAGPAFDKWQPKGPGGQPMPWDRATEARPPWASAAAGAERYGVGSGGASYGNDFDLWST